MRNMPSSLQHQFSPGETSAVSETADQAAIALAAYLSSIAPSGLRSLDNVTDPLGVRAKGAIDAFVAGLAKLDNAAEAERAGMRFMARLGEHVPTSYMMVPFGSNAEEFISRMPIPGDALSRLLVESVLAHESLEPVRGPLLHALSGMSRVTPYASAPSISAALPARSLREGTERSDPPVSERLAALSRLSKLHGTEEHEGLRQRIKAMFPVSAAGEAAAVALGEYASRADVIDEMLDDADPVAAKALQALGDFAIELARVQDAGVLDAAVTGFLVRVAEKAPAQFDVLPQLGHQKRVIPPVPSRALQGILVRHVVANPAVDPVQHARFLDAFSGLALHKRPRQVFSI